MVSTASVTPVTPAAASRFLAQASFGPTPASITDVAASGPAAWLEAQFAAPQVLHYWQLVNLAKTLAPNTRMTQNEVLSSVWKQAANGSDQLRQRMAFALSQIFVVSFVDSAVAQNPYGIANYYDVLGKNAFGNFRDLLQAVATNPMMGVYLSYLHNQKEDGTHLPDENFAREVMQLFTIGLYELNPDGTQKLSNGKPIETYTHDDVAGLAKVFTGWSWAGPDQSRVRFYGLASDPQTQATPMQNYAAYHSTSEKRFLGHTISGATTGEADMKVALDTLFNHPNVGPFIGRQLIQRLVSSNPTPAYVGRVAAAFADNGAGVRGDMKAVIRAVLLDPEATVGQAKLREPVLRLANWMRAFKAKSVSGQFLMYSLDDPLTGLGESQLKSQSVFNFYRPSYTPPNSTLADAGMVAPEMQITAEPSVTGYLNYMQGVISSGAGNYHDIQPDYSTELGMAAKPSELVDRLNLLLLNGAMSSTLRNQLITALNTIRMPTADGTNAIQIDNAKKNRVYLAIFLAMASPEYLVQ
jgi:uncharacterized protein (DUF1800 family)